MRITRLCLGLVLLSSCSGVPGQPEHVPPGHGWRCAGEPTATTCARTCDGVYGESGLTDCRFAATAWCFEVSGNDGFHSTRCVEAETECDSLANDTRTRSPLWVVSLCALEP